MAQPARTAPATALPARARWVIGLVAVCGAVVLGITVESSVLHGMKVTAALVVLSAFVAATWIRPLLVYQGSESLAIQFDEGCLTVMVLVLSANEVIIGFCLAIVVAEVVQRRSLAKTVFNAGQMLLSVGAAVAVTNVVSGEHSALTALRLTGAVLGAAVFLCTNSVAVGAVMASLAGTTFRQAVLEAARIRLLLFGGNVIVALVAALALSAYPWALPLVVLPFIVFRQVLAGHFRAHHDRTRLRGLFDATMRVHHLLLTDPVKDALEDSTASLLRGEASIRAAGPDDGELGAELRVEGQPSWLVVSGRSRSEPFDDVDCSLLEALGAVGSSALANAAVYHERELERQRLAAIASSMGEGVCALDRSGQVTFVNHAAEVLLGWVEPGPTAPTIAAQPRERRLPSVLSALAAHSMRTALMMRSGDTTFERSDGTSIPVECIAAPLIDRDESVGAVITFRDISERKEFEQRLTFQAFHDPLTGLPNRRVILDRLEHAMQRSNRSGELHAVLFADVDRFKLTNDSLGHHAGDELLRAIADRIATVLRPGDTLARFGGDEFAVLVEDVERLDDAIALAERIIAAMASPILLGEAHDVVSSVSIGITLTSGRDSPDDVLHDADVAMYEAKRSGPGRFEVFDSFAMGARSLQRLKIESALRQAVGRGEVEVYYQPVAASSTGEIIGAEALVRWHHPTEGLLTPDRFIGVAEETGLIFLLGRFVLEEACRQARRWRDSFGLTEFGISVNLSARQFQDASLVDDVAGILALTGLAPHQLCLEITENLAVGDVDRTNSTLLRLKDIGVRLAIDDFGTGYSSLSYLKRFPVDVVKVDRTFVKDLQTSDVDCAIVAAVIGLARAVGMTTVAEGVETEGQMRQLQLLGCPAVQGYLIARPLPADRLTALLAGRHKLSI